MGQWDAWIGRTFAQKDRLTPALLQRFRATLDTPGDAPTAPQGIHWALCTPDAATAQLGIDGHPRRSENPESFFPPIPLPRRMWASSKVEFLAPLTVDAEIERRSSIAAIAEKSGSTGRLAFIDVAHETRAGGALALREVQTLVYREAANAAAQPAPADSGGSPRTSDADWQFERTIVPSPTLLFRFSAITFNSHRIHYDWPYATGEEGYPGLVVHGPLMACLLLDLAQHEFGSNCMKSFSFRAHSPGIAGAALRLAGRRDGDALSLVALDSAGRTILSAAASL